MKTKEQHNRELRVKRKLWKFGYSVVHERKLEPEYEREPYFNLLVENKFKVVVTTRKLPSELRETPKDLIVAMVVEKKVTFYSGVTQEIEESPYKVFGKPDKYGRYK